jgi:hypothetical protein
VASFHFSAQIIGRSKGRSALAAAAYRSASLLRDEGTGQEYDYRRRHGVVHSEVLLPDGAAPWLADRQKLWNHVQKIERRRDAQLCREFNLALPHELTDAERRELAQTFVRSAFVARGMVADLAIHAPTDNDLRNHHAHVMVTLRKATGQGLYRVKTREWNSDALLREWRGAWAALQNRYLERGLHPARVDHRTLAEQRADASRRGDHVAAAALERQPEIHVGPRAQNAARRGAAVPSQARQQNLRRPKDGTWRSSRAGEKRKRTVDYRRIDRGNRAAFNAQRGAHAASKMTRMVETTQRRNARLRRIEARTNQEIYAIKQALWELREASSRSAWQRLAPAHRQAREAYLARRFSHFQRRSQLLRLLLGRADRILAGLFQVHTHALRRSRILNERSLTLRGGATLRPAQRPGLKLRLWHED